MRPTPRSRPLFALALLVLAGCNQAPSDAGIIPCGADGSCPQGESCSPTNLCFSSSVTAPAPPTGVSAVASGTFAVVTWTASATDGGAPITGYFVTASSGGATASSTGATTATVAGLAPDMTYTFTVHAVTDYGDSAESAASDPVRTGTPSTPAPQEFSFGQVPSSATAGQPLQLFLSVTDVTGALATGYLGKVHFTSSDPDAQLPADYTFVASDAGRHVFAAVFESAGAQTVTAGDEAIAVAVTSSAIAVSAGPTASFSLVDTPAELIAGQAFSASLAALDAFGNVTTGYAGTVSLSSSDPGTTLPASVQLVAQDDGELALTGLVFATPGAQTVTFTDGSVPAIADTQTFQVAATP